MYDQTSRKSSFVFKLIECSLVAFAVINVYNSLILYPFTLKFQNAVQIHNYMLMFNMLLVISCAGFAIVYLIIWHLKERNGKIKSISRHTFFIAVIRFWLAVMIAGYAFCKDYGNTIFRKPGSGKFSCQG